MRNAYVDRKSDIELVAGLLKERNVLDAQLARLIGRPPLAGHVGEWIAARVFGIELEASATNRGWDGRFTTPASMAGKTVDVKLYAKNEGLLDIATSHRPDFYLVLAGPRSAAASSRFGVRPFSIENVYLFDADWLHEYQTKRGVRVGIASSLPRAIWDANQIYPSADDAVLQLSEEQAALLALFRDGTPSAAPGDTTVVSEGAMSAVARQSSSSASKAVATQLITRQPLPAGELTRASVPAVPGLYAWWCHRGLLSDIAKPSEGATTSADNALELLYVGIAAGALRQRLLGDHLGSQTGSSTLRRALGAWLGESLGWQTEVRSKRRQHTSVSEGDLTRWMRAHLWITWAEHPAPREVEAEVIRSLRPPLNHAHNGTHPNYSELRRRREAWRTGRTMTD